MDILDCSLKEGRKERIKREEGTEGWKDSLDYTQRGRAHSTAGVFHLMSSFPSYVPGCLALVQVLRGLTSALREFNTQQMSFSRICQGRRETPQEIRKA